MKNTRRQFIKSIGIGIIGSGVILGTPPLALAGDSPPDHGFEVQKGFKVFNDVTQKNMEKLAEELVDIFSMADENNIYLTFHFFIHNSVISNSDSKHITIASQFFTLFL